MPPLASHATMLNLKDFVCWFTMLKLNQGISRGFSLQGDEVDKFLSFLSDLVTFSLELSIVLSLAYWFKLIWTATSKTALPSLPKWPQVPTDQLSLDSETLPLRSKSGPAIPQCDRDRPLISKMHVPKMEAALQWDQIENSPLALLSRSIRFGRMHLQHS